MMKLLNPELCLCRPGRGNVLSIRIAEIIRYARRRTGDWFLDTGSTPVRSTGKKMPEILERSDFSRVSGIFMWLFYRLELCVIYEINNIFCHGFCIIRENNCLAIEWGSFKFDKNIYMTYSILNEAAGR